MSLNRVKDMRCSWEGVWVSCRMKRIRSAEKRKFVVMASHVMAEYGSGDVPRGVCYVQLLVDWLISSFRDSEIESVRGRALVVVVFSIVDALLVRSISIMLEMASVLLSPIIDSIPPLLFSFSYNSSPM